MRSNSIARAGVAAGVCVVLFSFRAMAFGQTPKTDAADGPGARFLYGHVEVDELQPSAAGTTSFVRRHAYPNAEDKPGCTDPIDCLASINTVARRSDLMIKLDSDIEKLGSGQLTVRARVMRATPVELSVENYTRVGDQSVQPAPKTRITQQDLDVLLNSRQVVGQTRDALDAAKQAEVRLRITVVRAQRAVDDARQAWAAGADAAKRQAAARVQTALSDVITDQGTASARWRDIADQMRAEVVTTGLVDRAGANARQTTSAADANTMQEFEDATRWAGLRATDNAADGTPALGRRLADVLATSQDQLAKCDVTKSADCLAVLEPLAPKAGIGSGTGGILADIWSNADPDRATDVGRRIVALLHVAARTTAAERAAPAPGRVRLADVADLQHDDVLEISVQFDPGTFQLGGKSFPIGSSETAQRFALRFRVVDLGVSWRVGTQVVLLKRTHDVSNATQTAVPSNWKPTVAASLDFRYRGRARGWEWLVPSVGIAAALPDFDPVRDFELGLGLNIGWLNEQLHVGYGIDLHASANRTYVYLGLDFLRTVESFGALFKAGAAAGN